MTALRRTYRDGIVAIMDQILETQGDARVALELRPFLAAPVGMEAEHAALAIHLAQHDVARARAARRAGGQHRLVERRMPQALPVGELAPHLVEHAGESERGRFTAVHGAH